MSVIPSNLQGPFDSIFNRMMISAGAPDNLLGQGITAILDAAAGGGTQAVLLTGAVTNRGIIQLYDAGAGAFKYIYLSNGSLVITDTLPT